MDARKNAMLDDMRSATPDGAPALGADYMRCHVAFEAASDQQARILDWLIAEARNLPRAPRSIISVGAGSGILDVPLIAVMNDRESLRYTVVEPVHAQCEKFAERALTELGPDGPQLCFENKRLRDLDHCERHDLVLAIHSIYYVEDLEQSIDQLLQLRKPGGRLVIAVAPMQSMNRLAAVFWGSQQANEVWFGADVERCLVDRGIEFASTTIDGRLRIPRENAASRNDILSFLVQTRFDQLSSRVQETVLRYLDEVGEPCEGQLCVPHPVGVITVSER